jgi:hypothetical protein
LRNLWQRVGEIAKQVDEEHAGVPKASRFEPAASSRRVK